MRLHSRNAGVVLVGLGLAIVAGCSQTGGTGWRLVSPASQPARSEHLADAALFAPLPVPEGFDAVKARQPLEEIPGDPPSPAKPEKPEQEPPAQAKRHLEEAQRLFGEQRYTETIAELEKALRYDPNIADAHRQMALACLLSGNEARARLSAERALAIRPDDLPSHFVMARFAEKAGKPEEAVRHYRLALKCEVGPGQQSYRTLTHFHLGVLLFDQGYYAAAAKQLQAFETGLTALGEQAQENPALASVARVQRAAAAIRAARANAFIGQYPAAADALRFATAQLPKDFELRAEFVRMLVRAKRTDEAANEASKLLVDAKGSRPSVELLLAVYRYTGRAENGIAALKTVIAQQPDNVDLKLAYVDALFASGRKQEGTAALQELVAGSPKAMPARWRLVELYRTRGQWPSWLEALAGLLAVEPTEYVRVGSELEHIPAADARKLLAHAGAAPAPTTSQPTDALLAARDYLLGRLSDQLEQVDEAKRFFEQSAQRSPSFLPAAMGTAEMYLRRCRWDDAIKVIEAAEQGPQGASHQLERLLGQAYDGLDKNEQAALHYEKAIKLNSADTQSMLLLGRLYERTGQLARAAKQYQAAVTTDPGDMIAREELIQVLLSRMGVSDEQNQFTRVVAELNEMQQRSPNDPATIRSAALLRFIGTRDRKVYLQTLRRLVQDYPGDARSREDLAKALLEFRDYAALRDEASEMLARDSRWPLASELLASVLIKTLDFDDAQQQLDRMLKLYPNREAWLRQVVELRLIARDQEGAIAVVRRLLALDSVKGKPERELGYRAKLMQCYWEAGRFDEIRKTAMEWLAGPKLEPGLKLRYYALALSADAAAGKGEQYLADCGQWMKDEPKLAELRRWQLLGLVHQGRSDEAALAATAWLSEKPDDSARLSTVLEVLEQSERGDAAIELARSQAAAAERDAEKQAGLGLVASACLRAKRYDTAIETVKTLIAGRQKSQEETSELQQMIARMYAQAGKYDEALATVNELLNGLAGDLARINAAPGATSQTKLLAEAYGNNRRADLLKLMSLFYQRQGRMDQAIRSLRQAHALTPQEIGLNNDLGYMLADSGQDLEQARNMIRFALGDEPRQVAYMDSYGWALYKLGDLAGAKHWLTRACQPTFTTVDDFMAKVLTDPSEVKSGADAVILDHLADVQWRSGDHRAAVEAWKRSLQVYARQLAEGEENADNASMERVKSKLAAAEAGRTPAVATRAADSQPAGK